MLSVCLTLFLKTKVFAYMVLKPLDVGSIQKKHAATITAGTPGSLHGAMTYLLQTYDGQIQEAHSISAGLDYPGVGPEHSFLHDVGRVQYDAVTDDEALTAVKKLCQLEGILPALESAHAIAYLWKLRSQLKPEEIIVVLSFRARR